MAALSSDGEITLWDHISDYLVCVLLLAPPWYAAVVWRRLLLPGWRGPPARVAEAVAVSASLLLIVQVLGAAWAFGAAPVLLATAVASGVAIEIGWHRPRPTASVPWPSRRDGRFVATLAIGATAAVILAYALEALSIARDGGIIEYDSLWYHLPISADFVQSGALLDLTDIGNPPSSFYPFDSEAVHAIGMALLGHDTASLGVNLFWLAIALLAAWSIGLPFGRPWLSLLAFATVAATQVLVYSSAGTANSDLMGLALVLAAAALIMNARGSPVAIVLACLSAGLVVGTKLTMVPTAVGLFVVAIACLPAGQRVKWGRWALAGAFVAGSFWYIRNAIRADNPLPWVGFLGLQELAQDPSDCSLTTTAHWLGNRSVLSGSIATQADYWLGVLWLALVAVSAIGGAGAAAFARNRTVRMLGAVAVAGWLVYLVTPASGGEHAAGTGNPDCFGYNLRFALAPMSLGVLATMLAIPRKLAPAAGVALVGLLLATMLSADYSRWEPPVALAVAAGLVVLWYVGPGRDPRSGPITRGPPAYAALAACAIAIVAVTLPIVNEYHDNRYVNVQFYDTPLGAAASWARGLEDAKIGVGGSALLYPLYGLHQSNSVSYVEQPGSSERFTRPETCSEWRRALTEGRFDYIVTTPQTAREPPPPEDAWTRSDRRATEILSSGPLSVFAFDAGARANACG